MSFYTRQNARMGGTLVVTAVAAGQYQTNKQTNPQKKKKTEFTANEISLKYQQLLVLIEEMYGLHV